MPGEMRGVSAPGLVPLPAQALDGLETQFDPKAQRVPTHPNRFRRVAGQYDPRLQLTGAPDHQSAEGGQRRLAPPPYPVRGGLRARIWRHNLGLFSPRSHSTITVVSPGAAGARACSSSTTGSIQDPGRLAGRMRQSLPRTGYGATGMAHPRWSTLMRSVKDPGRQRHPPSASGQGPKPGGHPRHQDRTHFSNGAKQRLT